MIDLQLYTSAKVTNLESKSSATKRAALWSANAAKRKLWLDETAAAKRRAIEACDDSVECIGQRSWAERDAELRRHSISLE